MKGDGFVTLTIPQSVVQDYTGYRMVTCKNDEQKQEFLKKSDSDKMIECLYHGFYETKYHANRILTGGRL